MESIIRFAISWGPTIAFFLGILLGFLFGYLRGARKSAILIIHSLIAAIISITLFFVLVDNKWFDGVVLSIINMIGGSDHALQDALEVSREASTLREVLIEYIPSQMDFFDGLALIIKDNGAYLLTLVDMAYRLVFAFVMLILYYILIFIGYIIYQIFYPERRFMRKKNKRYRDGIADEPYYKNRKLGGILGFSRAFILGVISLSFLGSFFFVMAGGTGEEDVIEYDYGNDGYNLISTAYSSIGEYGTNGIFKVLNMMKDKDDTPYYLYAADLIFQGGLKDENREIDENILFREEFAAYVGFTRDTYDLMMKYGYNDLIPIINGESNGEAMDVILDVFANPDFQTEFDQLILKFDSQTYFVNLSLSLLDSVVKNIDEIELFDDIPYEAKEMIKICFQEGYLSNEIPYEKNLIDSKETDSFYENHKDRYTLGYISASSLVDKNDISELLRGFMDFITVSQESDKDDDINYSLDLISAIIDNVKNLSILTTDRADELNPVFKRLYTYIDSIYLTYELDDSAKLSATKALSLDEPFSDPKYDSINWVEEISSLIDVIQIGTSIYGDIYNSDMEAYDLIFGMFDEENPNRNYYLSQYDKMAYTIADSKILGEVLSSTYGYEVLINNLGDVFDGFEILDNIEYSNTYDNDGNLISYGEMYQIVSAIRSIGTNATTRDIIIDIINDEIAEENMFDTLLTLADEVVKTNSDGLSLVNNISHSGIVRSILTCIISQYGSLDGIEIYLDDIVKEKDSAGNIKNIITSDEVESFFNSATEILPLIKDLLPDELGKGILPADVIALLKKDELKNALDSKILEGTLSKVVINYLKDDEESMVVIPYDLSNGKKLVSVGDTRSEISILLNAINSNMIDLDVMLGSDNTAKINMIKNINSDDVDKMLESDILYYTLSNYLINEEISPDYSVIVPYTARRSLTLDSIPEVIKKNQLTNLIKLFPYIVPVDMGNIDEDKLIINVVKKKNEIIQNDIAVTTIVNALVNTSLSERLDLLVINENLKNAAKIEKDENNEIIVDTLYDYTHDNPWYNEIDNLTTAIDEIYNISNTADEDITFSLNTMVEDIMNSIGNLNNDSSINGKTKLELMYDSSIIISSIGPKLDEAFASYITEDTTRILDSCKDKFTGLYKFSEIESLVNAINILNLEFGIVDGEFEISNIDSAMSNLLTNILTLNDVDENTKLKKLDMIYNSTMVKYVFSNEINGQLKDMLSNEEDLLVLKDEYNLYKKNEIESLIDIIELFEIDTAYLFGTNTSGNGTISPEEHLYGQISSNLNKCNLPYKDSNRTNLEFLYDNNVFGLLLYSSLSKQFKIPTDALVINQNKPINVISFEEAEAVIEIAGDFDSINDIDLTKMDLLNLDSEIYSKSKIISTKVYDQFSSSSYMIIPNSSLNNRYSENNKYINETELYDLLCVINEESIADVIFEPETVNGIKLYDITEPKNPDINSFSKSELTTISNSTILSATVISQLNENLNKIELPSIYRRDAQYEYLVNNRNNVWLVRDSLGKNELSKAGDAFQELDIELDDVLSGNAEGIKTEVLSFLNNPDSFTSNNGKKSSFEIVYDSIFASAIISNELNTALTEDLIDQSIKTTSACHSKYSEIYDKQEIIAMYQALSLMGITPSNLFNGNYSPADFDIIFGFELDDMNILWTSYIVSGIITKQLDSNLVNDTKQYIYPSMLKSKLSKEISHNFYRYKVDEVHNLLSALESIFDVDSISGIDSINPDVIFNSTDQNNTIINQIYASGSYVMRFIVTKSVDDVLINGDEELVSRSVINSTQVKDSTISYYQEDELNNLIIVLNKLGVEKISDIENLEPESVKSLDEADYNSSIILQGYITNLISTQIRNSNGMIVDHKKAYENNCYKWSEIVALTEFLSIYDDSSNDPGENVTLGIIYDIIFDEERNYSSYILAATVNTITEDLIVPLYDYDLENDYVKAESMNLLLNALIAIYGDSAVIYDIDPTNFIIPDDHAKIEIIVKSSILNATVCKNMNFNIDGMTAKIDIDENYIIVDETEDDGYIYDINGNSIVVLTESEFTNFFISVKALGLDSFNTELTNKDIFNALRDDIDTVLLSRVIEILISEWIYNHASYLNNIIVEEIDVYRLHDHYILDEYVVITDVRSAFNNPIIKGILMSLS